MQMLNWYKELIQQFAGVYLIILVGLSLAIIIFLLFIKEDIKSKLMLQILKALIISCITMWLIVISTSILYFSMDRFTGISQHDIKILKDIMFSVTYVPMLFYFPLFYTNIFLQRHDKNSTSLCITDLLIKSILIYEILLFLPHYTIIMKM